MRFLTTINNQKCLEWGINATQGALVAMIYEANSWAKEEIIDDKVYHFVSRVLVVKELPLFFEKEDTVYRNLKILEKKGIIEYVKKNGMDLVRLTEKGKSWNFIENNSEINSSISEINSSISEINPSKFGNKSENNSEINPTYKENIYYKEKYYQEKDIKEKLQTKKSTLKDFVLSLNQSETYKALILEYLKFRADMGKPVKTQTPISKIIRDFPSESELREAIEIAKIKEWQGLEPKWVENYKKSIAGGSKNANTTGNSKTKSFNKHTDYVPNYSDWE